MSTIKLNIFHYYHKLPTFKSLSEIKIINVDINFSFF